MPSAAYTAWAESLAAERVVLCDLQAAQKLEGWINDSYETTVIGDGPVLYLRLDETSGTVADDEVNAANGTYSGTPTLNQAGLISDGASVLFDGVDDFVSVADRANLDITTNLSIALWMNATSHPVAFPRLLAKGSSSGQGYQVLVDRDVAGGPKLAVQLEGVTPASFSSTGQVPTGSTFHVVVTYDGSNVRIYLNGVLDSTTPATGSITTNATDLYLAQRGDGTARWHGTIDEAAVFNVVLDATQIAEHYALRVALTNTYRTTWSRHLTDVPVSGGIVVQLNYVKENATSLTSRASASDVNSNAGSYYYDHAASLIYVRTTGTVDPDTLSFVGAVFSFTLSTAPKAFTNGPFYDPRLTDATLPSISARQEDFLSGLIAYPSGEIAVNNADGLFDDLATSLYWEGFTVTFRSGGDALGFSDYEVMATMGTAQTPAASDTVLKVPLRSVSGALNIAVPTTTYEDFFGGIIPAYQNNTGKYLPLVYGNVLAMPLRLLGRAADPGDWSIGGRARYVVTDPTGTGGTQITNDRTLLVTAVNRTTGAVTALDPSGSPQDYIVGFPAYYIDILESAYSPDTYDFYANVLTTSGTRTIGQILKAILNKAGVPDADIDTASFNQADLDAPFILSVYIPELTTVAEAILPILRSVLGVLYRAKTGLWTLKIWDPSCDWANTPLYLEQEFGAFEPSADIQEPLAYQVRVRYAQRLRYDYWPTVTSTDGVTRYGRPGSGTLDIDTKLTDAADAAAMAGRYRALASQPTRRIDVELPTRALTLDPLEKIRVTRARAHGGVLDKEPFQISAFTKRLSDQRMSAQIDDQRGLGDVIKKAAADGTAGWDTATEAERRTYGYAHDDATERVDSADATTYHHAEAW